MQQFLMVAAAHFLALLSPGPDFFLVARTSIAAGWRTASGVCLGIALANGVFIVAAFSGLAMLRADGMLFQAMQLAGCAYLLAIGVLFLRHAGSTALAAPQTQSIPLTARRGAWLRGCGMGFVSGILNPKNALFYASLAAMVGAQTSTGYKLAYGLWMCMAVLLWDMAVAAAIGNQRVLRRFAWALPWLERASGALLIALALAVLVSMARSLLRAGVV